MNYKTFFFPLLLVFLATFSAAETKIRPLLDLPVPVGISPEVRGAQYYAFVQSESFGSKHPEDQDTVLSAFPSEKAFMKAFCAGIEEKMNRSCAQQVILPEIPEEHGKMLIVPLPSFYIAATPETVSTENEVATETVQGDPITQKKLEATLLNQSVLLDTQDRELAAAHSDTNRLQVELEQIKQDFGATSEQFKAKQAELLQARQVIEKLKKEREKTFLKLKELQASLENEKVRAENLETALGIKSDQFWVVLGVAVLVSLIAVGIYFWLTRRRRKVEHALEEQLEHEDAVRSHRNQKTGYGNKTKPQFSPLRKRADGSKYSTVALPKEVNETVQNNSHEKLKLMRDRLGVLYVDLDNAPDIQGRPVGSQFHVHGVGIRQKDTRGMNDALASDEFYNAYLPILEQKKQQARMKHKAA